MDPPRALTMRDSRAIAAEPLRLKLRVSAPPAWTLGANAKFSPSYAN